jgi:hypothetical protein
MEIGTKYGAVFKMNSRILNPFCMWVPCMECANHFDE